MDENDKDRQGGQQGGRAPKQLVSKPGGRV